MVGLRVLRLPLPVRRMLVVFVCVFLVFFCFFSPVFLGLAWEELDLGCEPKKAAHEVFSSLAVRNGSASLHLSLFCSNT